MASIDPLTKLYVEITTACNLDCAMCVRRSWNEPIGSLPLSAFETLMDQLGRFSPVPTIHLSGYGEPMAHANFLEIVSLAKASEARVEMTTNGVLLDADTAATLVDLDLDSLTVSIDGVQPESYEDIRVKGSFDRLIDNIRQLHRLKLRRRGRHGNPQLGIAFVAMKRNLRGLSWERFSHLRWLSLGPGFRTMPLTWTRTLRFQSGIKKTLTLKTQKAQATFNF